MPTEEAVVSVSLGPNAATIPEPVPSSYEDGVATIALDDAVVIDAGRLLGVTA